MSAAIKNGGRTGAKINAGKYQEVLEEHLLLFVASMQDKNVILQQDNYSSISWCFHQKLV